MAYGDRRIYHSHRPWRTAIAAVLTVVGLLILAAVLIFFYFKRYIVYTADSARLVVPWLMEEEAPPPVAETEDYTVIEGPDDDGTDIGDEDEPEMPESYPVEPMG